MNKEPAAKKSWLFASKPPETSWPRWVLRRLALPLALALLAITAIGVIFKNFLIFHPDSHIYASPEQYGLKPEEVWLQTSGGLKIKAWNIPAPPGGLEAALLFFQGNSGNMTYILPHLAALHSLGLSVMAVDYPGYGQSEGRPSEDHVYQAAESLWQYAVSRGYSSENIIIYGFSLGGGVASYLAEKHHPAALVLDSTFTRLRDVPSEHAPFLAPYFKLALGDAFDTEARLANLDSPLLVIHRTDDSVVPYILGKENFDHYRGEYKSMVTEPGDHMDFILHQNQYLKSLKQLLQAIEPPLRRLGQTADPLAADPEQ